ncbi:GMC family oxidoreductase [Klenkia terrae]|uniref:GMC family oxidoreductase N-terminal domain-containing protein n=1 Tax=Klenkia terrae TaxID=1052259 RepID=A0ABU8E8X1_9ACTN|nr:GMC family oxidoreductase N-terminal domain-containing protein [Klenkia terrae]
MTDVVVVGAGSAGCALAARLVDAGRSVLLLEAGTDHRRPEDFPATIREAATMGAAVPGHPANWDLTGELTDGVRWPVPRGKVLGGSSALNGTYFIRATREDCDGWAALGNDLWSADALRPAFDRSEADPLHGTTGPLPVSRVTDPHPITDAFTAACLELGFPAEPDKNADAPPGVGPVPLNVRDGVRVNAAMAYLSPRRDSPGLTVRGDSPVVRVLVEHGRAVGVRTADGTEHRAAEVVLSCGAVGTPHLLMLSGIGPADALRAVGVDVLADVPGVGADVTDHPDLYVTWSPTRRTPMPRGMLPLTTALNTPDHLEVMPWLKPFSKVMLSRSDGHALSGLAEVLRRPGATLRALRGTSPAKVWQQARTRDDLYLGVALQAEDSRGTVGLTSADPSVQPRIRYRYLSTATDRERMRRAVRLAADLLGTGAMAGLVQGRTDLPDDVLADDAALDRWTRAHLATAIHLSGSARMGPAGDPGAVVDQHLRVRGVEGLRVADTSVLPTVPTRGPAATAVAVGERAAELMTEL